MPAQLLSLTDGPNILLDKPILLVGRHPECDIQIESRKISRRHCCIAQVSDYLVVRDLGSTNGIRINGVRVLEGQLKTDDELAIGGSRFRVTWDVLPNSSSVSENGLRRRTEPARNPSPVDPDEDELLEDCDEPVPLSEPDVDELSPRAIPIGERGQPRSPLPKTPAYLPSLERKRSGIIPESLELSPLSEAEIRPQRPAK